MLDFIKNKEKFELSIGWMVFLIILFALGLIIRDINKAIESENEQANQVLEQHIPIQCTDTLT